MGNKNRNAFLMEILLAVLFFALCASVLLKLFMGAYSFTNSAELTADAAVYMQDLAEQLKASGDGEQLILQCGFTGDEDGTLAVVKDGYTVRISMEEACTEAGRLNTYTITAFSETETLGTVECARYIPGE